MNRASRLALLALLGTAMICGAACAKKKPAVQTDTGAMEKMKAETRAEEAKRDAWMTQGVFVAGKTEWQAKITQAVEKTEALTNFQMGLYSDAHGSSLEFDGELNQGNCHFYFNPNHKEFPIEFYILDDRYYTQEADGLADNGPKSRETGEKLFMPLLLEMRASIKQAAQGEIKDLGAAKFEEKPVHKYDCKIGLPGNPPEILAATVEIDEAQGLLLHAVVGNGVGTESSEKRFAKHYREVAFTKIGQVGNLGLPAGVTITPFAEDINSKKLGMP